MGELIRLPVRPRSRQQHLRELNARLVGATLRWRRYRACNAAWLPGRCEVCHSPFLEGGGHGTLGSGYTVVRGGPAGEDDYLWICAVCFEGQGTLFGWMVEADPQEPHRRGRMPR